MLKGKRLRIYYMAQVDVQPPRFILFVNYPHLMVDSYQKYLYNQFREIYKFTGVPILFHLKGRVRREQPPGGPKPAPSLYDHSPKDTEEEDFDNEYNEE